MIKILLLYKKQTGLKHKYLYAFEIKANHCILITMLHTRCFWFKLDFIISGFKAKTEMVWLFFLLHKIFARNRGVTYTNMTVRYVPRI